MLSPPVRIALVTVPIIQALGILSARLSNSGYGNPWFDALAKPAFMPLGWAFPVAWTILYALIAVALALVLATPPSRARRLAVGLFAAQFALNLAWAPVFFGLRLPGPALAIVLAMIALTALTTLAFRRLSRPAALLMLPYLGWLCFAAALNEAIISLN